MINDSALRLHCHLLSMYFRGLLNMNWRERERETDVYNEVIEEMRFFSSESLDGPIGRIAYMKMREIATE